MLTNVALSELLILQVDLAAVSLLLLVFTTMLYPKECVNGVTFL